MNFADYIPTILFSVIIAAAIMKLSDSFTVKRAGMVILGLPPLIWLGTNVAYNKGILPRLYSDTEIKAQDLYDMFTMSKGERDSIIDLKANSISLLTKKQKAIDSIFLAKNEGQNYTLIMQSQQDYNRILGRVSGNQDEKTATLYKAYVAEDSFYVKDFGYQKDTKDYRLFFSKSRIKKSDNGKAQKEKATKTKRKEKIGKDASEDFEDDNKLLKEKKSQPYRNERALPPPPPPYKLPPAPPSTKASKPSTNDGREDSGFKQFDSNKQPIDTKLLEYMT